MSDAPKIYPFKRSSGAAAAEPAYHGKTQAKSRLKSYRITAYLRALAIGSCFFLLARAQILGGLYPFGPACLAAAAVTYPRKGALSAIPVLLGLYSSLQGEFFLVYTAIIALLAVIFQLYHDDGKKQWFVVPGMVLAATLVSKGLLIALTTFTDYQLMISIFESVISAGLSLVFLVILSALRRFDVTRRFTADETICIFLAAMGMVCGLNGWYLGTIEVQSMVSRLLIMIVAYLGGGGAGAAVGAMLGVIPSLSEVIVPSVIASYCFSGLLAGVFGSFGRIGTAIGFLLGNMILALYILTAAEISAGLVASAAAGVLFLLIPAKLYRKLGRSFAASGLKSAEEERNARLLRVAMRKLRNSSWAFRDLANSLSELSGEDKINEEANIRAAMEQLSHQLCARCSMKDICWEIDYHETFRGIIRLFETVRDGEIAELRDAPENFSKRCPHIRELIAIVNCLFDLYCRSNFWQLQRISSRRLISNQLEGAAEVLEKIASEITDFGEEREILERELQRAMARRGMPVEAAGIGGVSDKAIDVWVQYIECPGEGFCRQAVEEEVGRLLGCPFYVHETSCGGKNCAGRCSYRLLAGGAHHFHVGKAQLAKNGREVCGDSGGSLLLDEGRQLLLISDGMGVGDTAARESGEAISLVSRLLDAGFRQDTAVDIVNAVLSLRGEEESFVTLDLCIVDLYTGMADFIKTGAAASFIKRGSSVRAIKGSSLPVGMLYHVEKEVISEQIMPGDMIILASDGLLDMDIDEEGQWLTRIIEQAAANTPQALAEYLLDKVISISGGKIKDDITVLVAQMGEVA